MVTDRHTVVMNVFMDRDVVSQVVGELRSAGYGAEQIGVMLGEETRTADGKLIDRVETVDHESSSETDGRVGLGPLLGAAVTSAIPGVGPIIAAGILAAADRDGGVPETLAGMGMSEDDIRFYMQEVQSGRAVVMVRTDQPYADAVEILRLNNPHHEPSVWVFGDETPLPSVEEAHAVVPEDEVYLPEKVLNRRAGRVPASHEHEFDHGVCTICGWMRPDVLPHQDPGPVQNPDEHEHRYVNGRCELCGDTLDPSVSERGMDTGVYAEGHEHRYVDGICSECGGRADLYRP